jgi:hypothetical protein
VGDRPGSPRGAVSFSLLRSAAFPAASRQPSAGRLDVRGLRFSSPNPRQRCCPCSPWVVLCHESLSPPSLGCYFFFFFSFSFSFSLSLSFSFSFSSSFSPLALGALGCSLLPGHFAGSLWLTSILLLRILCPAVSYRCTASLRLRTWSLLGRRSSSPPFPSRSCCLALMPSVGLAAALPRQPLGGVCKATGSDSQPAGKLRSTFFLTFESRMASVAACLAEDLGSIPGCGVRLPPR